MFTIRSGDPIYNSPMIGSGHVVTTLGPTGYHNGFCLDEEAVNRTIFWAGRRLSNARSMDIRIPRVPLEELIGPTRPLLRLGRLLRTLVVNGQTACDDRWEQTIDYERAVVTSTLDHGGVLERTESRALLNTNLMVFHTSFTNQSSQEVSLSFKLEYEFADAFGKRPAGMRLHIRRPHPDDLSFGNVEGTRSLEGDPDHRPPHLLENLSVQYEIEGHLGEVRIGRFPTGVIRQTSAGGIFSHDIRLQPSQSEELWFWVAVSDRLKYTHFPPDLETVNRLLMEHESGWEQFWQKGRISIGDPELEAVYRAALYTLRSNANEFTVPVASLSTHWEGRIFHDDFYAFLGLSASNHLELARRVLQNRLNTIPTALRRSQGHGTYFGWEVTEDGEESAPYGHWTDEQFRHGQISETGWRYYLYTRNLKDLERVYPLLKGCAEWLIHDTIVTEADGSVKTRLATDILEAVYPVKNSILVSCAAIKTLRNAALVAELLRVDAEEALIWRQLADELQKNLPVDRVNQRYRYADNADAPLAYAHSGMVFPFAFDLHGELAQSTVDQAYQAFHARQKETGIIHESQEEAVLTDNWMWEVSGLASALFYQRKGNEGYVALQRIPHIVGPFMTPCEHFRAKGGPYLPWFGTGSGIYIAAVLAMFVQVLDEAPTLLLPALPDAIQEAHFDHLLASQMVIVSGEIKAGKLVELIAQSDQAQPWVVRIPASKMDTRLICSGTVVSFHEQRGDLILDCRLERGENYLVKKGN